MEIIGGHSSYGIGEAVNKVRNDAGGVPETFRSEPQVKEAWHRGSA